MSVTIENLVALGIVGLIVLACGIEVRKDKRKKKDRED